ncbi:MAG: flagellar type III secretion system pore protein FliP [Phycisphaerales bacterium]
MKGWRSITAALVCALAAALPAAAQTYGPPMPELRNGVAVLPGSSATSAAQALSSLVPESKDALKMNPLAVMDAAGRALPGGSGSDAPGSALSAPVTILLLLTIVSLAPAIVLMTTCFPRILIVLGLLKQAIGAQGIPPPQIITALALFMTLIVMAPTYDRVYREAIAPWSAGEIRDMDTLWLRARQPVRDFMFDQIEASGNWNSLYMMLEYRGIDTSEPDRLTRADVDMVSLIPAFMISELKAAFLLGFRIYLPFLVIDMVISSLLISMSMMMLPPVLISLPFKLLLFVMVDGWQLVVGGLLRGFVVPGSPVGAGGGA